ncbi:MAG: hypothetical protein ABWX88_06600 [Pseudoxanthomonas sp.]
MKSGRASQTSPDGDNAVAVRRVARPAPGRLSRTESMLDNGARRIDLLIDALRDRPMIALGVVATALALLGSLAYP